MNARAAVFGTGYPGAADAAWLAGSTAGLEAGLRRAIAWFRGGTP